MSNLDIKQRRNKDVVILDLSGRVHLGETSVQLRTTFRSLVRDGERKVLVSLADVNRIDSGGLGELVAGFVSLRNSGGEMKLTHLTDSVNELMVITKLLTVFDVFDNEEEAIASFNSKPASASEG